MMNEDVKAFEAAINDLEKKERCGCIGRQTVINAIANNCCWISGSAWDELMECINSLPSITPQPKTGRWVLTQRGKYIDVCCSECGYTRVKDFAYGYTIDELNLDELKDIIAEKQMNYCECCGARMEVENADCD